MNELAQWIGIIITAVNGVLTIIDKKLYKKFIELEATTPQTAIKLDTLTPLYRWRVSRNKYSGIIFDKHTERYFYAESLKNMVQKKRRFRFVILMSLAIILVISFT